MQRHATRIVGAALGAVLIMSGLAGAQVQTGDKITMANADKVKDLLSPAMYWLVQHGWSMVIADTQRSRSGEHSQRRRRSTQRR